MTRISTAPTRRVDTHHRSPLASDLARMGIEVVALAAFCFAVVLWAVVLIAG